MSVFVLDASVANAWLLGEQYASKAEPALLRLESDEALDPQLWHLEVRNSLLVADGLPLTRRLSARTLCPSCPSAPIQGLI